MQDFDLVGALLRLLVFIPAVGLHEYCHAKFADMAGDMTPRAQGRVTLNPLAHLDPIGTIMMVLASATGAGIGWGRPVMVNVSAMRNPRWDHFISVIMGPISNFGQAVFYVLLLRFGIVEFNLQVLNSPSLALQSGGAFASYWVTMSLIMNLGMFFFNMIPFGPLDGHWLVGSLMPVAQRNAWYRFCHGPGMIIFLVLVLIPGNAFNPIGWYMDRTMWPTLRFLLGKG